MPKVEVADLFPHSAVTTQAQLAGAVLAHLDTAARSLDSAEQLARDHLTTLSVEAALSVTARLEEIAAHLAALTTLLSA
jgi:hypothetical protein